MNELKETKPLPATGEGLKTENASLNQLLGMLNNPALTGATVPPGERENVRVPTHPNKRRVPTRTEPSPELGPPLAAPTVAAPTATSQQPSDAEAAASPRSIKSPLSRVFFTGTMGAGKDWVAKQCGFSIIGFADPLYALVNALFPELTVTADSGKDIPGVRELLQALGQWGRGEVNSKYPYTPARALMRQQVFLLATSLPADLCVDWPTFGVNKDIWLDSLVERAKRIEPGQKLAATNVRFENEHKRLASEGWVHYHVMCSAATRMDRLKRIGIAVNSPALTDVSEKLALFLDQDVVRKIKAPGNGSMLRVIWNDTAPPPSKRLYTVNQWMQELAIAEAVPALEPALAPNISLE